MFIYNYTYVIYIYIYGIYTWAGKRACGGTWQVAVVGKGSGGLLGFFGSTGGSSILGSMAAVAGQYQ